MKASFFLLLLFATAVHANTYYVSATGNDDNNGTSPVNAFKTLTKVNTLFDRLQPGDKVLLKRGDIFYSQKKPDLRYKAYFLIQLSKFNRKLKFTTKFYNANT